MARYLIPGKSLTRPPRINTVEYLCRLCLIPGIWQMVFRLFEVNATLATFRFAELDVFYAKNEQIYNFVNSYKLQLDIYIKFPSYIKNSFEFLLRIYRLSYNLKLKKKL